MWITTRLHKQTIVIGTAHRPPWQNPSIFFDAVSESITALHHHDGMILLGDFNINLLKMNTSISKLVTEFLSCFSLKQLITEFITQGMINLIWSGLIDLICNNIPASYVQHIPELGAHAIFIAEFKIKKPRYEPSCISIRLLRDIAVDQSSSDLSSIKWELLEHCDSGSE
ncbi:unnamed protein product [Euphydryas editha]|uniref:Endonuclease/exonuclease/phosphatase domain-containing protein n=1 Tax=Euphydryas editha TaxID=104508 RepID=A0AAU9V926_EUPED|nr:unnamed protein product [Euphydryas editha]